MCAKISLIMTYHFCLLKRHTHPIETVENPTFMAFLSVDHHWSMNLADSGIRCVHFQTGKLQSQVEPVSDVNVNVVDAVL